MANAPDHAAARRAMVEHQLAEAGIRDRRLLDAMAEVPREAFVPPDLGHLAYADRPLPIGGGQTISQPYVVALMLEALQLRGQERVLEVGTGSGYAAALLGRLAGAVIGVERLPALAEGARQALARVGADNVTVEVGDGSLGWPDGAPYDAIVVAASGPDVPPALVEQLLAGGRLVMPVGDDGVQDLVRITRTVDGGTVRESLGAVRFVPLIGACGWPD